MSGVQNGDNWWEYPCKDKVWLGRRAVAYSNTAVNRVVEQLLWEADICLLAPSVNIECEIQEGHWTPCALFFSSSTNFA